MPFWNSPQSSHKIGENAFGAHFLQLCRKNEYGDPHFLFHYFNKNSASFQWEKNWHESMFSFLTILLICGDWAIMGSIARVKIKSTLECKVKTRAKKGIFLVRKWMNNTFNSNSVRYPCINEKISPLCLVLGCTRFCQRVLNSRICQHCNVKTIMVTPTFYYFFIIFLTCYISVPSFIYNLC